MRRTSVPLPTLGLLLAALLAIGLAACGSESSTATGPTASTPTSSAPPDDSTTSDPTVPTTAPTTAPTTTTPTTDPPAPDPTTPTTIDVSNQPTVVAGTYQLPLDEPVAVGGGATLRLVELEDSRCPEGVMCVWEGELTAGVVWSSDGVDAPLDLTWAYHADPTAVPGTGLVLALDDATPGAAVVTIRAAG